MRGTGFMDIRELPRLLSVSKRVALSDESRFRSLISCISNERSGPLEHETSPCRRCAASHMATMPSPSPFLDASSLFMSHLLACQCPIRHWCTTHLHPARCWLWFVTHDRRNGWTWWSSTDSRDRRMINGKRTNMYSPCPPVDGRFWTWIWNTRSCYRYKERWSTRSQKHNCIKHRADSCIAKQRWPL